MIFKRGLTYCIGLGLCVGVVLVVARGTALADKSSGTYRHLQLFARVLAHLEKEYVAPVEREALVIGAIKGMVRTLDPHSAFLPPEEFEVFEADTRGRFGGVGMEVGVQEDRITVIAPIPGSPADKAGVLPGDQLLAIDGLSTADMPIHDAVKRMRGVPGTTVRARLARPGVETPIEVILERAIIHVDSVRTSLVAPGYPWIQVRGFQDGTTGEVKAAIAALTPKGGGLKGILLDLRRNPGGVLHEAVALADLFLDDGTILTTRGKDGKTLERFSATRRGTLDKVPMVTLVDGASASAAEIVAGALQDHGRSLVVGVKSFGKGSVQSLFDVGGGYGLKLTTARYFTPRGRSIQAEGVLPDVVVASRLAPEPDPDTKLMADLPSEKDLPGHLAPQAQDTPTMGLADIADYQLRIAAQLLIGLANQATGRESAWQ